MYKKKKSLSLEISHFDFSLSLKTGGRGGGCYKVHADVGFLDCRSLSISYRQAGRQAGVCMSRVGRKGRQYFKI